MAYTDGGCASSSLRHCKGDQPGCLGSNPSLRHDATHPRGNRYSWLGVACAWLALAIAGAVGPATGAESESRAPSPLVLEALAYEHGEGVRKDQLKAATLYCDAARDGDSEAQFSLGWMYVNGRGVARDDAAAAALFARAAAAGHPAAQKLQRYLGSDSGSLPDCMRPPEPTPEPEPAPQHTESLPPGPDPFANMPTWKQRIADQVAKLAPQYAVDARLALAVIAVESNFEPTARSVKDARGLMQLIPGTATRFNVKHPFDITDNLRGGSRTCAGCLRITRGKSRSRRPPTTQVKPLSTGAKGFRRMWKRVNMSGGCCGCTAAIGTRMMRGS